ncbi:MAG TPA: response regulator [Actinomycetota bacterium]|nr:response regulator [Actinomycetota bacterium]
MADVILVADDDPDILRFVELNLRLEGYEVLTAVDGEQALAVAHDRVPSLVILDVMMPKLDGYQVCQRLRTDGRTTGVCIIMLTAKSMSADKVLGLTAGADDYISKPFDPMELVARVKTTLRRTREMRSVSPLTGLPGNVQIEAEMQRRVADGETFAVLWLDLDNFKAFNDRYGFIRGDSAINYLATVLREVTTDDQFVGHIGGDDFVVLASADECESLAQAIVTRFDKDVKDLYDPEDAARGTVVVTDRLGRELEYPLLSVSIGAATNEHHPVKDYRELAEVATEMKSFSKKRPGSVYAIDRRGSATTGPENA